MTTAEPRPVTPRPVFKDRSMVTVAAGTTLRLLVIAAGEYECAGIDMGSGGLVRGWSPTPCHLRIRPYDVVEVTLDQHIDAVPDPAQPEALGLVGPPRRLGWMRPRRAEAYLRPLIHPADMALLGVTVASIAFWERSGTHPSIAIVEPEGRTFLHRDGDYLACRFGWQGHRRELPCLDRSMAGLMDRAGRAKMAVRRSDRLVVALTPPIEGRCHKVVQTILGRR